MKLIKSLRIIACTISVLFFVGCTSAPPMDYSAFKHANPASILILPPVNRSPDVNASNAVLSQMSVPLAESGYYVIPVALMNRAFRENGIQNPDEAQAVASSKLSEIFGADAALYSEISEYGARYQVISSETAVTIKAKLIDLRTGTLLWEGAARASSKESDNSANSAGLAGLLIKAVVDQIVSNVTDNSYLYSGIASDRLLTAGSPRGILHGKYSPKYGVFPNP